MKIVSKYKDFYDSFGYILGEPDESITYVRTPKIIDDNNKEFKNVIKKLSDIARIQYHTYGQKENYIAFLETVVCGFYPYIYICPFYVITHKITKYTYIPIELNPIPVSEEYVHDKAQHDKVYNKVQQKFDDYCKKNQIREKLYISKIPDHSKNMWYHPTFMIEQHDWKIESPDIFRILNVPTFMYVNKDNDIAKCLGESGLILNPIFVKQKFDVLGANRTRITNEQNVYIDIENFLWETKKEPESIPDNKTKIVNAGFDLKTSFRNM